jgi:hypothetical protein
MMALVVAAVVSVGALVLRMAFWTIFLPFRLIFGLLFIPFWIARTLLKMTVGIVMLPVLLIGGILVAIVAAVAALVAVITPLLPLLIVGLLVWAVFRSFSRPVAA